MLKIKNIYEFQDMMISALRYALGRKTYITLSTANFIKGYPEVIDSRVKKVMLNDLEGCFIDNECDYKTWTDLYDWLNDLVEKVEEE